MLEYSKIYEDEYRQHFVAWYNNSNDVLTIWNTIMDYVIMSMSYSPDKYGLGRTGMWEGHQGLNLCKNFRNIIFVFTMVVNNTIVTYVT